MKITGTALGLTLVASLLTLHCANPEDYAKVRVSAGRVKVKSGYAEASAPEGCPESSDEGCAPEEPKAEAAKPITYFNCTTTGCLQSGGMPTLFGTLLSCEYKAMADYADRLVSENPEARELSNKRFEAACSSRKADEATENALKLPETQTTMRMPSAAFPGTPYRCAQSCKAYDAQVTLARFPRLKDPPNYHAIVDFERDTLSKHYAACVQAAKDKGTTEMPTIRIVSTAGSQCDDANASCLHIVCLLPAFRGRQTDHTPEEYKKACAGVDGTVSGVYCDLFHGKRFVTAPEGSGIRPPVGN